MLNDVERLGVQESRRSRERSRYGDGDWTATEQKHYLHSNILFLTRLSNHTGTKRDRDQFLVGHDDLTVPERYRDST